MRIGLAFRLFFKALFNREVASALERVLVGGPSGLPSPETAGAAAERPAAKPQPKRPARSDALTLLATLQREARFVDMVQEPLTNYTDAQIGAAARDVFGKSAAVLDRLFALRPVVPEEEGAEVETPPKVDPGRFHLTGNVTGQPPFRGQLVHHGWEATCCEVPQWNGEAGSAMIVAPVELELK